MNTMKILRSRRSVRSFDSAGLPQAVQEEILQYAQKAENPYGLAIHWQILSAKADRLSSPVITGADTYIAGRMDRVPHAEEAFGFAFEKVVLYAQSKGIGTTWIGGTMDRSAFERAIGLKEGEVMPCVSPLGVPAKKMSLRETMMRKAIKADTRLPFESLFFAGGFETPLSKASAGDLADALEMVRLAPSAVNKQPWRLVIDGSLVHFYEKHDKGYVGADGWDMQKIDLGIALCHFVCGMEERGKKATLLLQDPGLVPPANTEYIATLSF